MSYLAESTVVWTIYLRQITANLNILYLVKLRLAVDQGSAFLPQKLGMLGMLGMLGNGITTLGWLIIRILFITRYAINLHFIYVGPRIWV